MMYDFSFGGIYDDAFSATILTHIWMSMTRVYGGFFLAAVIGIPLGLMIGRIKMLRQLLDPTINVLRPIPVTAWLPLSMIFFGLGPNAAIFLVFLGAFYPILLNTIFGVRSVDPRLFEAASMLGCSGSAMFRQVVFPAALPSIFNGLAHRARLRLDPDRGRRDDRRADRPGLGDHGRPHAVAHRSRRHRHDRDRRDGLHHRPDHRDDLQPRAELEPAAPCLKQKRPPLIIRGVTKRFPVGDDEIEALARVDVDDRRRAVRLPDRRLRLRQVHAAADRRRASTSRPPARCFRQGKPITGPGSDRGMVFQDYALFPWMTVRENIGFGPRQRRPPKAEIDDIADEFLKLVGLERFADRYPSQLSGGMKQRVAIARVLANNASTLLMDEPFGALDALTREQLQHELLQIWARTGVTVIFVTHSVEEAVLLADRVLVMSAGPGRIENDITIDLPRPRDVSSPEFNAVRRDVARRLTSHLAPGRALEQASH